MLAIRLRKNKNIKGINITDQELLLSLFADDLAIILEFDVKSWNTVSKEFDDFEKLSGS